MLGQIVPLTAAILQLLAPISAEQARMSNDERIIQLLNLTTGYCKGAAPPPDRGTANIVNVKVYVTRISGVDTVKQEISLDLWLAMIWTDIRLAWNDTKDLSLAKVDQIFVPMDWLWVPDVALNHPVEFRNFENSKFLAVLSSDGAVHIEMPMGITSKCPVKIQDFPFDSQQCNISFSSAVKTKKHLQLEVDQRIDNDYDELNRQNNEFCLRSISSTVENFSSRYPEFKKVLVAIKFERKPLYYVTVLILPSALILVTCIFGFLLPADTGDRLALNVAILLSMSVFLQLAGSITPAQSESVPVLTWYFTVAIAVTTLSTIGSIIVHLCYRRAASHEAVSSRMLRLLFLNRLFGWSVNDPGDEWRHVGSVLNGLLAACAICLSSASALFLLCTAAKSGFGGC